jgi:cytochrome c553
LPARFIAFRTRAIKPGWRSPSGPSHAGPDGAIPYAVRECFPVATTMKISRIFHRPHRPCAALLAFGLLAAAAPLTAQADGIDAGKLKAQSCAVCHGANGISQTPGAPHLAGQPAIYVVQQLKNFRSGKRSNEIMNVIAKPLSDTDISDLAAWFESIKIKAEGQ